MEGLSDDGVPAAVAAVWPWARAPHVHAAEAFAAALPTDAIGGGDGAAPPRLDSLLERLRAEGALVGGAGGGAGLSVAALPPLIELHAVALADARGGAERRAAWPPADALAARLQTHAQHAGSWLHLLRVIEIRSGGAAGGAAADAAATTTTARCAPPRARESGAAARQR